MNIIPLLDRHPEIKRLPIPFSREQILIEEGNECKGIYFVLKGEVKISSYSLGGREIIYNSLKAGMMFGNNLVFSSDRLFRGHVIGVEDGELIYIRKEDLLYLLQKDERFLVDYLSYQSDFGRGLNEKIKILGLDNAKERLLYYLSVHHGEKSFASITALAEELFLKRETLSRLLHSLEKEGIILLSPHKVKLL